MTSIEAKIHKVKELTKELDILYQEIKQEDSNIEIRFRGLLLYPHNTYNEKQRYIEAYITKQIVF